MDKCEWIEWIDNERYIVSEEELKDVLELHAMIEHEHLISLPTRHYYAIDRQDYQEWLDCKPERMELAKKGIQLFKSKADSYQSPVVKKLFEVNEEEICLELVDIEGTQAHEFYCYYLRERGM